MFVVRKQRTCWDAGSIDFQGRFFQGYNLGYVTKFTWLKINLINRIASQLHSRRQIKSPHKAGFLFHFPPALKNNHDIDCKFKDTNPMKL